MQRRAVEALSYLYGSSYLHRTLCHAEGIVTTVKGARALVLEKYMIPGGSSGFYTRDSYPFDMGFPVVLVSGISAL